MRFTSIFDATKEGSVEDVRYFVEQKSAGVNARINDGSDWTPLHFAVRYNPKVANYLVSKGADVNMKTNKYLTPLHIATGAGNIELAKILISAKADVNAKADNHWTPLYYAVSLGNIELAKTLVSAGADVNAKDNAGYRLLEFARYKGNAAMVQYLISQGAGDIQSVAQEALGGRLKEGARWQNDLGL